MMNVTQIQIDPEQAVAKFAAYEKVLKENAEKRVALSERERDEYKAALEGFRSMADGKPVVLLSQAISEAPVDEAGRPLIAIARADREQVRIDVTRTRVEYDCQAELGWWRPRRYSGLFRSVARPSGHTAEERGYALVPMIPADVRRDILVNGRRVATRRIWILWEVEEWSEQPISATPDRDPLALFHLGGDAYAVLAAWDLTDLERAIMAGRAVS